MFIKSRFVVVDDKNHHLLGIKESLNFLRLDCHSKLYTDEDVGNWQKLPGTRILFLDQNLTTGATFGSNNKVAFAALADVVSKIICPESGPYGLVLWAEQPDLEELKVNMFERFVGDDVHLLPVFFTSLRKGEYIDTSSGQIIDADKLQRDLMDRVSQSPQLKALLTWEADVSAAMDAVLRSVTNLVPTAARCSDGFSDELGKVLYRLSQAGAGIDRAEEAPREAINRVLVPILADRILEHDPSSGDPFDWKDSLVNPTAPSSVKAQASVNTAIHLSFARSVGSAPISPTELGAIVELPSNDLAEFLISQFGLDEALFRESLFIVNELEWADCRPRLIQIGAPCDGAQPKPGPLLYLFALEWPFANEDGKKLTNDPKPNLKLNRRGKDLEWQSPILDFCDGLNPGRISAFKNLALSVPRATAQAWKPVYRFREELISEVTHAYARHISRIGIVTFPEK